MFFVEGFWGFVSNGFVVVQFREIHRICLDFAVFVELCFQPVGYGSVLPETVDYGDCSQHVCGKLFRLVVSCGQSGAFALATFSRIVYCFFKFIFYI